MVFPSTPKPVEIRDTPFTWPSVETQFEAGYRQVRNLIDMEIRGYTLTYDGLTDVELAVLHDFWKSVKGKALPFTFNHPRTHESINCRFAQNTFEPERVEGYGRGWHKLTLVLEEARL